MQKKRSPDGASVEKSASSTAPSTDGGAKRRKTLSPSEVRTALQEAADAIGLLKAELAKARAQNNQWLLPSRQLALRRSKLRCCRARRRSSRHARSRLDMSCVAQRRASGTTQNQVRKEAPPLSPLLLSYPCCLCSPGTCFAYWIAFHFGSQLPIEARGRGGGGEGGGEGKREGGAAAYARLESKFRTLSCPVPRSGAPFSGIM
jgi:hypothetical protein